MKCQLFSGKIRKTFQNVVAEKFTQSASGLKGFSFLFYWPLNGLLI